MHLSGKKDKGDDPKVAKRKAKMGRVYRPVLKRHAGKKYTPPTF